MAPPCSRNLTQQPAFGGDDIAFCAFGLGTKTRHLRWVTLSEQKWVILAERRGGWSNDVNGPIFYQGQYHLFWQAFPFGIKWDSDFMYWGHAVSKDMIHW